MCDRACIRLRTLPKRAYVAVSALLLAASTLLLASYKRERTRVFPPYGGASNPYDWRHSLFVRDDGDEALVENDITTDAGFYGMHIVTTDPKPIAMLGTPAVLGQIGFIRDNPREGKIRAALRRAAKRARPGDNTTFLDVGMNDAFYSLLAASYGVPVVAFEPQPLCIAVASLNVELNGLKDKIRVINGFVSDDPMGTPKRVDSRRGCDGTMSMYDIGKDDWPISTYELDDVLGRDGRAIFAHIDVEGAELSVLRSARKALREGRIAELSFEFSPHRWTTVLDRGDAFGEFDELLKDYDCVDLHDDSHVSSFRELERAWSRFLTHGTDYMCTSR